MLVCNGKIKNPSAMLLETKSTKKKYIRPKKIYDSTFLKSLFCEDSSKLINSYLEQDITFKTAFYEVVCSEITCFE
jgi:hypothetical protein